MSNSASSVLIVCGKAIEIPGDNIDTDRIIPARFMRGITFDGLGDYAFYDERFDADGAQKSHSFNDPRFSGASILIVGANFGCGSSREHAPQALMRLGIRAIIGLSFADIFAGNCTMLGIPAVSVSAAAHQDMISWLGAHAGKELAVDIASRKVSSANRSWDLQIEETARTALIEGLWDTTALLLSNRLAISDLADRLLYFNASEAKRSP